ncbi:MAG: toxin HipA [Sphingomonadales bacterium 32-64-17]|nr:MAG: toxin HipA [Sphingomonadales bacterium 32-64-17]
MARKKSHAPLDVYINNRLAGQLLKEPDGAISFTYDESWLEWEYRFPVSLCLQLQKAPWRGEPVSAVFENLLPDNPAIRRKVAERTGAAGSDAYSLLEEIGRDCVGAMQFLHEGERPGPLDVIDAQPVSEKEIEKDLANLGRAPLALDPEHGFRISIAGAQDKTSFLLHDGKWMKPSGTTPTTHIFKPEIGTIPTSSGEIDLSASVDNEHYCLVLLEQFGLHVAQTQIRTFGKRRVLVVERFDRELRKDGSMLRLPQEDCCQALGVPPSRKYQSTVEGHQNGPGVVDIMKLLQGSDTPNEDREAFFKSQIIFWLIGATDGHAKNFSIFLRPGGGFQLTPFYDVLTAQPVFDKGQISQKDFRLAMSVGKKKYKILDIMGRHFVEVGKKAGLGPTIIGKVIKEVLGSAREAPGKALERMPDDFPEEIHASVEKAIESRLDRLESGFAEL